MVVALYWINLAKLELHFPEFPCLYDYELGLAIRKVNVSFRRWKCGSNHYTLRVKSWAHGTVAACAYCCWCAGQPTRPARPQLSPAILLPSPWVLGQWHELLCSEGCPLLLQVTRFIKANSTEKQIWVPVPLMSWSLPLPSATAQWGFFPISNPIYVQAQHETQRQHFFNSYRIILV